MAVSSGERYVQRVTKSVLTIRKAMEVKERRGISAKQRRRKMTMRRTARICRVFSAAVSIRHTDRTHARERRAVLEIRYLY